MADWSHYVVGLDLGQSSDPTALAVIEATRTRAKQPGGQDTEEYSCRHLERFPLRTPYPDVIEQVKRLLTHPLLLGRASLVVDATGVGAPVVDLLRREGLSPVAVTITGGDAVSGEGNAWRVPKRDLVGALQILLQNQRLRIAEELPTAALLVRELLNFRVKITMTAHDVYGAWREGEHDDLVLAVALAVWWARRIPGPVEYRSVERRRVAGPPDSNGRGESPLARRRAEQERVWHRGNPFGKKRGIF